MKILNFSIFVKKIFPNNVVLWCSMIITLFLAGLPPPPCYKMLCFSWPPPPPRGHNVIYEWPLLRNRTYFSFYSHGQQTGTCIPASWRRCQSCGCEAKWSRNSWCCVMRMGLCCLHIHKSMGWVEVYKVSFTT